MTLDCSEYCGPHLVLLEHAVANDDDHDDHATHDRDAAINDGWLSLAGAGSTTDLAPSGKGPTAMAGAPATCGTVNGLPTPGPWPGCHDSIDRRRSSSHADE
jgi:hypothetical protein